MPDHERFDAYLKAATAGLKDDAELQLDVQAELRSHIASEIEEQEKQGQPEDAAAEHALQALGPVTELAPDLASANRRRMKTRALLRMASRALLVPAAVILAISAVSGPLLTMKIMQSLTGAFSGGFPSDNGRLLYGRHRLSPAQKLILHGDLTRPTVPQQQRAIWEAFPTNRAYLGNYVSYLANGYEQLGETPETRRRVFRAEIARAEEVDPDNARYHYLLAAKLLDQAAELVEPAEGSGTNDAQRYAFTLKVKDSQLLKGAMDELRVGLGKPVLRRYGADMLGVRLAILGHPQSMIEQIGQISIAAGMLIPDLSCLRQLARVSPLYAERLIGEGHQDEARPFIQAWEVLTRQLANDTHTLIDVLVVQAIAQNGEHAVPAVLERAGDKAAAERERRRAAILSTPGKTWRAKRDAMQNSPEMTRQMNDIKLRSSILTALLLPALGEFPDRLELAPQRLLDYVQVEQGVLAVLMLLLLAAMVGALTVSLRWRFARGGAAGPMLLLPDARQMLRILGYGVLLPLLVFYVVTRWLPGSKRDFNVVYLVLKTAMQVIAFAAAVVTITSGLTANAVRKRCRALSIPVPSIAPWRRWASRALACLVAVVALGGCLPDAWHVRQVDIWSVNGPPNVPSALPLGVLVTAALLVAVLVAGKGLMRFGQFLFGSRKYGLYYGTTARSLIPPFAAAIILLGLLGRGYLGHEETILTQSDTLLSPSTGFTMLEARVTDHLKQGFLDAAAKLDAEDAAEQKTPQN